MNFSLSHSFNVGKSNLPTVDYSIKNLLFFNEAKNYIFQCVLFFKIMFFISCLIYVCV